MDEDEAGAASRPQVVLAHELEAVVGPQDRFERHGRVLSSQANRGRPRWSSWTLAILILGLTGCNGHVIRPQHAPNYASQGAFDFKKPPCLLSPKPELGPDDVAVRYLGTGGLYIEWRNTAILMSPFFSNPGFFRVPFGHLATDEDAVRCGLGSMDLSRVRALAAGHSHYDHIGDLPLVAERYVPQARIYVNQSGVHALASFRDLAGRITSLESTEEKGWVYLEDPAQNKLPIRFRVVRSEHAPHFWGVHLSDGSQTEDWTKWNEHRFLSLREGQPFAFVIDLLSPDLETTRFRLYYQDSVNPPKYGLPRLGDETEYDLAVLCMASFYFVRRQPGTTLRHLQPHHILATHYEDFFRGRGKPVRFVRLMTNFWANRFFLRARRAMENWEAETRGPEGQVCGPSSRSWTMPMPGEWLRFRAAPEPQVGEARIHG